MAEVLRVRRSWAACRVANPLFNWQTEPGQRLGHGVLAKLFWNVPLGHATLGVDVLNYLQAEILAVKPRVILECGSGISTVCLAQYVLEASGRCDAPGVVSLEEDATYVARTVGWLERAKLTGVARVLHAPLVEQRIDGFLTSCYWVDGCRLEAELNGARANLLVVDGPVARGMRRFGTIPLLNRFLEAGAKFYLDDAFRDWELQIARMWLRAGYVNVWGIHPFPKGLLVGSVTVRSRVTDGSCVSDRKEASRC